MSESADNIECYPWETPGVSAFISQALGGDVLAMANVSALTQGLSNDNALIEANGRAWVLRINRDESSAFCQRAFEAGNWQLAARAGLAPPLLAISDDGRCYLSHRLDHGDWPEKYAEIPASGFRGLASSDEGKWLGAPVDSAQADARLLLALLKGLQQLPLPANAKGFTEQWQDYQRALDSGLPQWQYCDEWRRAQMQLASCAWDIQAALERIERKPLNFQYSHRDLTPHNLLCHGGKLYCIDFEYACASHPLWDLATVLASHRLTADAQTALVHAYLDFHPQLDQRDAPLIVDAVALHWYFGAIWALLMAGQSGDNNYLSWFHRYLQLANS
ncbi:phosphotransferase [Shewanella sp.]|uniref:phosphotransferase n=1 Tax=Shewanella sp. TaxID=50422 RepID=UPI003569DED9